MKVDKSGVSLGGNHITRRKIEWEKVEAYLREYIGSCYEILETAEKVYIGADVQDEFCCFQDKIKEEKIIIDYKCIRNEMFFALYCLLCIHVTSPAYIVKRCI